MVFLKGQIIEGQMGMARLLLQMAMGPRWAKDLFQLSFLKPKKSEIQKFDSQNQRNQISFHAVLFGFYGCATVLLLIN
jgi:hypothetical protein